MSRFFGRLVRLTVQTQSAEQAAEGSDLVIGVSSPEVLANGRPVQAGVFTGLHLSFKAEKSNLGHPATLDLSIINLAPTTRAKLQEHGYVILEAGYRDDAGHLPVVFEGNARTIDHVRKGADWVTRIQCGDGETAYRFGRLEKSYSAGTQTTDILKDLANAVKDVDPGHIDISSFLDKLPSLKLPKSEFLTGYASSGNAYEQIQRLLGGTYDLMIRGGSLQVLGTSEVTQQGFLIDSEHGMVGSPEHGSPNPNGLQSILKVSSLLNARIGPGDMVAVKTAADKQAKTYRVQKVNHAADIAGPEWQTDLECLPGSYQVGNLS